MCLSEMNGAVAATSADESFNIENAIAGLVANPNQGSRVVQAFVITMRY